MPLTVVAPAPVIVGVVEVAVLLIIPEEIDIPAPAV